MCNPPDEAGFKSIEAPKIKGDYLLSWEGEVIVGDIDYIFNYISNNNLHVHACVKYGKSVNIEIHDFETIWYELLYPVTDNQYKDCE